MKISVSFKHEKYITESKRFRTLQFYLKKQTRDKAFDLIIKLVQNDPKSLILLLMKGFIPLSKNLPIINPDSKVKTLIYSNHHGYKGIQNPGCICYMNAVLQ